jgi:beta-xylosidase
MLAELSEGEYAVRAKGSGDGETGKIFLAATTYRAYVACVEYLLDTYYNEETGLCIPTDLDAVGHEKEYTMITTSIPYLRDPFILAEDGVYYAYGTGWVCYRNTSGDLEGPWEHMGTVASVADPAMDGGSHWAPEVHKYNGAYYMFTTYYNSITGHRGCTVMRSETPLGPFVEITGGHITPADWDSIDGTLYVDPEGQPWMVFVHEWTCMPGGIGSFAAARLSEDLTHFVSEPIELFKANEPAWAAAGVTDGCWMYTTKEGELLMVWSNFDAQGYVVAVARSSNGRLDGEWIHEEKLLYSKAMTGEYDGGHAMILTDPSGQMYLSFHSPNSAVGDRHEKPVLLAIREENGKLVWDEPKPIQD